MFFRKLWDAWFFNQYVEPKFIRPLKAMSLELETLQQRQAEYENSKLQNREQRRQKGRKK